MDKTIDYSAFPKTFLVIAVFVAIVYIVNYLVKRFPLTLKPFRRERLRPTWSPSLGKYVYVPVSQIHNITSARPRR